MKKLDKKQTQRQLELVKSLGNKAGDLREAITVFNEKLAAARVEVEERLKDYNEALDEARGFRDDVVADMEAYVDERSEKWQDSDAGSAYISWKDSWEQLDLEDASLDIPDDIEDLDDSALGGFEELPVEPG
ncbi:hypothetical protein [Myxococcus phage Mx1]|nr:hypothetical protein [Myxococcus phage Mx1]